MTIDHPLFIDSEISPGKELNETSPSITSSGEPALEYTGERMVPEANHGQLIYTEHLARYMFAAQFAAGKTVLDFGSGEGYGVSILAHHGAASVSGIDISPVAVEHARKKYLLQSIDFVCADCLRAPFTDKYFDLITSFEVIEHLTDHAGYIGEVCRLLKEDGTLIISTPNITNSDGSNCFHLKELGLNEFIFLLRTTFKNVKIYAQTDLICSMVYDTEDKSNSSFLLETMEPLPDISEGIYFLAVCSNTETAVPVQNKCMASVDEEYPRLNSIIKDLSSNADELTKAVEDHIIMINNKSEEIAEKDKLIDSLIRERADLYSVFTQYRNMMPFVNRALSSLRNDLISVESTLSLAQICLAVNITDSARWFLSRVLQQEPDHTGALFQMGELYFRSGKPGLAREYIRKVLQKDNQHHGANALLAAMDAL
jgi:2-polyprenyl-3-methyl-5-hydroxy-6-metoxy-1,4-benzoquinol methylase